MLRLIKDNAKIKVDEDESEARRCGLFFNNIVAILESLGAEISRYDDYRKEAEGCLKYGKIVVKITPFGFFTAEAKFFGGSPLDVSLESIATHKFHTSWTISTREIEKYKPEEIIRGLYNAIKGYGDWKEISRDKDREIQELIFKTAEDVIRSGCY